MSGGTTGMSIGWALPITKIDLKCKATFVFPGQIPFFKWKLSRHWKHKCDCACVLVCISELTLAVEKSVYLKIFSRVFCMLINFHHLQIYLQTNTCVLLMLLCRLGLRVCQLIYKSGTLKTVLVKWSIYMLNIFAFCQKLIRPKN